MTHSVGDIITLSTIWTMREFNKVSLPCEIVEVRNYHEPSGLFSYAGYICKATSVDKETMLMLIVRTVGSDTDMFLYFLDNGMSVSEVAEFLIAPSGQDLVPNYTTYVTDTENLQHEIVWQKKPAGTFFGIEFSDSEGTEGMKTVCEYSTASECGGNPLAFIDWSGDATTGWVEIWVGAEIKNAEVTFSEKVLGY